MVLADLTRHEAWALAWFPADGTPRHRDPEAPSMAGTRYLSLRGWIEHCEDGWRLTPAGMEARAALPPSVAA